MLRTVAESTESSLLDTVLEGASLVSTLVVSSTLFEVAASVQREFGPAAEGMGAPGTVLEGKRCHFLITGVGQAACGVHLSRTLARRPYDRVIQAGIAGSFSPEVAIGSVVVVGEEAFGDLGAEDNGSFLDLFDMGLLKRGASPFSDQLLVAPIIELPILARLPRVRSVTVNRVLSEARSIAWIRDRYAPQVVNMEGAAFFYAALLEQVPFVSLRAISDSVGPRDRSAWKIPEAISALDGVLAKVIEEW
jgi:futalosine hydrolase